MLNMLTETFLKHSYMFSYHLEAYQSTYIAQNHIHCCWTLVPPRWTNSKGHGFKQPL